MLLRDDLQQLFLRKLVVSQEAITNSWMQNNVNHDNRICFQYGWKAGFNTGILSLPYFHGLGMQMLYQHNTFRFTRLVTGFQHYENPTTRIIEFL